jgi:putative ABC transport system ATP-binding protein
MAIFQLPEWTAALSQTKPNQSALIVEDVHKVYHQGSRTIQALRGVSLEISRPGYYAIMGPSGSGKSTLLHLLAGLDRADSGRLVIAGQEPGKMSDHALTRFRRTHIGLVFQQFNLIPTLTARQNVALPAVVDRRSKSWINTRVNELLDELGMTERAEHRPDAMSGGEQQRIAIARALLFSPQVILADEPTGNLDTASSDRLWRLLGKVAQQHQTTVVMVTHEPAAAAHCESVFVMRDGQCHGHFETEDANASAVATRYQQFGR